MKQKKIIYIQINEDYSVTPFSDWAPGLKSYRIFDEYILQDESQGTIITTLVQDHIPVQVLGVDKFLINGLEINIEIQGKQLMLVFNQQYHILCSNITKHVNNLNLFRELLVLVKKFEFEQSIINQINNVDGLIRKILEKSNLIWDSIVIQEETQYYKEKTGRLQVIVKKDYDWLFTFFLKDGLFDSVYLVESEGEIYCEGTEKISLEDLNQQLLSIQKQIKFLEQLTLLLKQIF